MKRKKKKIYENLVCIVDYPNKDESKYADIKEISAINEERTRLAKSEHETYTGESFHREQCASIPNEINHDKHGIHLEPCYKQFMELISEYMDTHKTKVKVQHITNQQDYDFTGQQMHFNFTFVNINRRIFNRQPRGS